MKTLIITIVLFLICIKSLTQTPYDTSAPKEHIRKVDLAHAKAIFDYNTAA
ncbi:hypothetical protein OHD16_15410 [Sphingobacterium sp. ML3W]|uniref:hypothetical protein n=1 Tax=Sphingobacterium sp. ML3W TaxID=1538644 RepID=UPI00249B2423|nr:hypothetical protein [Sphingobacterium sp. ML3W]WFA81343.1 hypothetical protein OGI71_08555 [Sphingobacterium sp. ML3W]